MTDNNDLADGKYRARAVDGAYGTSKNGTEEVAVLFETETGHRRTWHGYFTDKTTDRTLESLKACGVTDLETLAGISTNEVELVLKTEEYEGKARQKVAWVNAIGTGAVRVQNAMAEDARRSFTQRLKGKWIAMGGDAPAAQPVADDDKIPF